MIGIIGFGRFGELMTRHLSRDFKVHVLDRSGKTRAIQAAGALPADLKTACTRRILVLSVPISRMQAVLAEIAPLTGPKTLVADVCSVKMAPVKWMREILPPRVGIMGTHPMFGPDSAARSLLDRKIVVCPVRISPAALEKLTRHLRGLGLNVVETTPEDHDRQIAHSLSLTHFIGRSLASSGAEERIVDTEGYKRLIHILDVTTHDSWQLFEDMNRYNPFAAEARKGFIAAMTEIEERLQALPPPERKRPAHDKSV